MNLQGLGDYDRSSGYVEGDVTLTYETIACNYDRARMFNVDTVDDLEAAGTAFGNLAGEFIRNKVAPELDAFRLACYANRAGVTKVSSTLSTGADVVTALRTAVTQMDEDEVPPDNRYLFITPTLHGLVQDMDTTKSREVLSRFAGVIDVPQSRFYSKLALKSGRLITTGSPPSRLMYSASGRAMISVAVTRIFLPERGPACRQSISLFRLTTSPTTRIAGG